MYNVSQGVFYNGVQTVSPTGSGDANNGLSVETDYVLGQAVGASGNPANLLNDRQIPLNGHIIEFKDGTSKVTIGQALLQIDGNDAAAGQPEAMIRFTEAGPTAILFEMFASRFAGGAMIFDMGGIGGNGGMGIFKSGNVRISHGIDGDSDTGQVLQVSGKMGVGGAAAVLNFPNTLAQTSSDLTIALPGAVVGDMVMLGVQVAAIAANSSYTAWVSAANVVTVRFNNYSAAAINPAGAQFSVSAVTLV